MVVGWSEERARSGDASSGREAERGRKMALFKEGLEGWFTRGWMG